MHKPRCTLQSSAQSLPDDPAPPLNLSSALLALEETARALEAASEARRRDPDLPQARYMVGLALMKAGNLQEAIPYFETALRLAPTLAEAWVNLGVIRYRLYDVELAKSCMRHALAAAPGHVGPTGNLGAFLRLSGDLENAERLLDEALRRNPDAVEVRLNLIAALISEDRPHDALSLLEAKSPPRDPRLALHWRLQLALALLQVGRVGEDLALFKPWIGEYPIGAFGVGPI